MGRRFLLGPLLYLVAFATVFIDPFLSLLSYLLLVGLYLIRGPGDLPPAGQEAAESR